MIITNDLIMVNFPKTGSSFARKVLKEVYSKSDTRLGKALEQIGIIKPDYLELMCPTLDANSTLGMKGQHGTVRQIPSEFRDRPIVSIVRNPLSRYVSNYLYRWWAKYPPANVEAILKKYPNFPNLTFPEYYEMVHLYGRKNRLKNIVPKMDLGINTIQFIQFYFEDPVSTLKKMDDEYIKNKCFFNELENIHFIRQENLKEDLKRYLLSIGIDEQRLEFIDTMRKVNVTKGKPKNTDYMSFYKGTDIIRKILARDKLLFQYFPGYLPKLG